MPARSNDHRRPKDPQPRLHPWRGNRHAGRKGLTMARSETKTPVPSKTPVFDALIEQARRTPPDRWISHEELGRRLDISEEEHAAAQARIQRRLREDAEDNQAPPEEAH